MKKIALAFVALTVLSLAAFGQTGRDQQSQEQSPAQPDAPTQLITIRMGAWYDAMPLPAGFGDYAWNFNLRWGYSSGMLYLPAPWLGLGMEAGIHLNVYRRIVSEYLWSEFRMNFPVEAKVALVAGIFSLEAFGGITFDFVLADQAESSMAWLAGTRLSVGPVWADGAWLFPTDGGDGRLRVGGGLLLRLNETGGLVPYR